jgi:uncharacterized membrane protein YciS (DUF1049 family)
MDIQALSWAIFFLIGLVAGWMLGAVFTGLFFARRNLELNQALTKLQFERLQK